MQAKLRVSAPRRSQLIGSTLAAHAVRDLPLPKTGEGAILGPTTTPNPGNVGSKRWTDLIVNRNAQYAVHKFPFAVVGEGGWALFEWVKGYEQYWRDAAGLAKHEQRENDFQQAILHADNAKEFGEHLRGITEQYQVSYIELDRQLEIDKVCDIFTQIKLTCYGVAPSAPKRNSRRGSGREWYMRMTTALAATVTFAGLLAAADPANAAAYTFTTIDVPGAPVTVPRGVNDAGQIVGVFEDSRGGEHGFLDTGGSFTTIDVPGATLTSANGINDAGQIVGIFNSLTPPPPPLSHGFLDTGGSFTTIDPPGSIDTAAYGINGAGQIVGIFSVTGFFHGFLDTGGSFTTIAVPGAIDTDAYGINDAGQIVGSFLNPLALGSSSFLDTSGTLTVFNVPSAIHTLAYGINDAGQIAGYFVESAGGLFTRLHGFLDTGGSFTQFDVPGASNTQVFGINDAGQIVGQFFVDNTERHGFLATPVAAVPEPSGLALLGVGVIGLGIIRRRKHA